MVPDGSVKLGFRAHYPQIETKLTVRGRDADDIRDKLGPVEKEVRVRLGNFILAEDDQTLEGVVLAALTARQATLALVETFTAGAIAGRLAHLPGAEQVFRRGVIARDLDLVPGAVGLPHILLVDAMTEEKVTAVARAAGDAAGASHALAVLIELDAGSDRIDLGGTVWIAIAHPAGVAFRRSRIVGGREWVRLGAAELALDCLRRFLQDLPVVERIDFEKV
jgi:nicotinamide-nucleotide amidase